MSETKLQQQIINITPDIAGGCACIRNTSIAVWFLHNYRILGWSDQNILESYPDLSNEDLKSAWDYFDRNRDEINNSIRENE